MNILIDRHHADLVWGLKLLADRLGATLYLPYGVSWFDEGYFNIYGDLRKKEPYRYLAKKYLEDTFFDFDGKTVVTQETYHGCVDYPKLNVLTLEKARQTKIDVIVCSLHENEEAYARLKEFWPEAKMVRQVGNDLDVAINESLYPNLLSSATEPFRVFQGHKILYKQEWDTKLSVYQPPLNFKNIFSFQNNLEAFEDTWEVWTRLKHQLRDYIFKSYGNENDDGKFFSKRELYKRLSESTFGFQSKNVFEGYGFQVHTSIFLGRPMIIRKREYANKAAEPLLKEGVSYLEMGDPELPDKVSFYSEPERFRKMSEECRQMWNNVPSFDEEFIKIKKFFEELI